MYGEVLDRLSLLRQGLAIVWCIDMIRHRGTGLGRAIVCRVRSKLQKWTHCHVQGEVSRPTPQQLAKDNQHNLITGDSLGHPALSRWLQDKLEHVEWLCV